MKAGVLETGVGDRGLGRCHECQSLIPNPQPHKNSGFEIDLSIAEISGKKKTVGTGAPTVGLGIAVNGKSNRGAEGCQLRAKMFVRSNIIPAVSCIAW